MDKKIQTSSELLCKGFPVEFVKYLEYCKHLKFEDEPDYKFLRSLLKDRVLFKKCFNIYIILILWILFNDINKLTLSYITFFLLMIV